MTREVSFRKIVGLNNRLPITRMTVTLPDRSKGVHLLVADNIDVTDSGLIRRREGFSLALGGAWHSVWGDAHGAYGVRNGDLVRIESGAASSTVVVASVGDAPVSFVRPPDGFVYWSNGARIGRLDGTVATPAVSPAPNPVPVVTATAGGLPAGRYQVCFTAFGANGESRSTEPVQIELPENGGLSFSGLTTETLIYATGPDGEVFNEIPHGDYVSLDNFGASCQTFMLGDMPPGQALAHYRGSLLVARGKFLYISEPYRYGLYNPRRGFIPLPAEISIVQPCEDGVYVCADKTYWIPGDPLNTAPIVVLPYGALPGSTAFDIETQTAYWQGPNGVVIGRPGGNVTVPQDAALIFGPAESGSTLLRLQRGEKHLITARLGVAST